MAYKGGAKVQKVMVQPINLIFRYLQNRSRISVWLYEQINLRIEGCIVLCFELSVQLQAMPFGLAAASMIFTRLAGAGFDEYMNLVLDEAEEVHLKAKSRKSLGRILLKGDNITLIQQVQEAS